MGTELGDGSNEPITSEHAAGTLPLDNPERVRTPSRQRCGSLLTRPLRVLRWPTPLHP